MLHDQGYKSLFSHPLAVEHLMRGFIVDSEPFGAGPDWLRDLDYSSLERMPTEQIDHMLHSHINDMVWRVPIPGGEDWLHLLIMLEFQSDVDRLMALRIRSYTVLLYEHLCRERELTDRLPPVLPVVLYNGGARWTAAASVRGLVFGEDAALSVEGLLAGEGYMLVDVGAHAGTELPADNVVSLIISTELMRTQEEPPRLLAEAFELLRSPARRELKRVFVTWFSLLAQQAGLADGSVLGDLAKGGIEEMEQLERRGDLRTALRERFEAFRAADRAEGVKEGIERGIERERALLCEQAGIRFGAATSERLAARLAGIDSQDRLLGVARLLLECDSGDEFLLAVERLA